MTEESSRGVLSFVVYIGKTCTCIYAVNRLY